MAVTVASNEAQDGQVTAGFWGLTLGSIGVVFGDIGTSPLYAFRVAVAGATEGQPLTRVMVLGVLSLILWALLIVVTTKYVLFSVQSSGTARVASAFGPVMVLWFSTLAVMGVVHISDDPSVLAAINPWYAVRFLLSHGTIGLVTLGAVFLAVTAARRSNDATDYFQIPTGRVVEVGTQVTI
jgi:KUP system potassium uptake protein